MDCESLVLKSLQQSHQRLTVHNWFGIINSNKNAMHKKQLTYTLFENTKKNLYLVIVMFYYNDCFQTNLLKQTLKCVICNQRLKVQTTQRITLSPNSPTHGYRDKAQLYCQQYCCTVNTNTCAMFAQCLCNVCAMFVQHMTKCCLSMGGSNNQFM